MSKYRHQYLSYQFTLQTLSTTILEYSLIWVISTTDAQHLFSVYRNPMIEYFPN